MLIFLPPPRPPRPLWPPPEFGRLVEFDRKLDPPDLEPERKLDPLGFELDLKPEPEGLEYDLKLDPLGLEADLKLDPEGFEPEAEGLDDPDPKLPLGFEPERKLEPERPDCGRPDAGLFPNVRLFFVLETELLRLGRFVVFVFIY